MDYYLIALLFVFFYRLTTHGVIGGINKCGNKKLEICTCGYQYIERSTKFVVNCTNTGLTTTEMLKDLPEQTNYLIFTGNHLNSLPINIFGEEPHLSQLEIIDMSNNGIREIKGKTFHHVTNVERLILNHNNISIADEDDKNFHHPRVFSNFENLQELFLTNAFADNTDSELANDLHDIFVSSNLTKLFKLHLEQNEIKNWLDPNVFCDLPNLQDLYLGDNKLPSLNFNISCLKKLRFLDLEYNNITRFVEQDLNRFDKLRNSQFRNKYEELILAISNNPIKCDDSARNLYNWILKTSVKIKDISKIECINYKYNNNNNNRYLINLKSFNESSKHSKISKALTVLLVILVCLLITLIIAFIYLKKDIVRKKLSPVFDIVSRKVQYTSIVESQDV